MLILLITLIKKNIVLKLNNSLLVHLVNVLLGSKIVNVFDFSREKY